MTVTDNTTTENNGADVTVGGFFRALKIGQYVTDGQGFNEQVYIGQEWDTIGNVYAPRLFNLRSMHHTNLTASTNSINREDGWREVFEDNGTELKVAPEDMVRALQAYADKTNELSQARQELWKLRDKEYELQSDWDLLNGLLNDYAEEVSFCSDYERRLDSWNEQFKTAKLKGRVSNYDVAVSIPELSDDQMWVSVRATSPAEANRLASEMTTTEILREVFSRSDSYSLEFKTQVVEVVQEAE